MRGGFGEQRWLRVIIYVEIQCPWAHLWERGHVFEKPTHIGRRESLSLRIVREIELDDYYTSIAIASHLLCISQSQNSQKRRRVFMLRLCTSPIKRMTVFLESKTV